MKRRLPKGVFTRNAIEDMPLEDRMAISRIPFRKTRSRKAGQKRLNRLERQAARKATREQDQ